jgi:ABC-type antimicrobial peptide transport system permease subunit
VQADPLTWRVTNLADKVEQSMAEPRFTMSVLVLFAASAVVLAAVGLFGVLSYTLGLRTREIGVRLTLGASRRSIAALFMRDAVGQTALGMALGLAGMVGLMRLVGTSIYGVHGFDTITCVLAAASTLFASATACAAPLFRATRIDPIVALRAE